MLWSSRGVDFLQDLIVFADGNHDRVSALLIFASFSGGWSGPGPGPAAAAAAAAAALSVPAVALAGTLRSFESSAAAAAEAAAAAVAAARCARASAPLVKPSILLACHSTYPLRTTVVSAGSSGSSRTGLSTRHSRCSSIFSESMP